MEKRVKLLSDWEYDGEKYEKGLVLELDERLADELLEKKVAEDEPRERKKTEHKSAEGGLDPRIKQLAEYEQWEQDHYEHKREKLEKSGQVRLVRERWQEAPGLMYHQGQKEKMSYAEACNARGQWLMDIYEAGTTGRIPQRLEKTQKHILNTRRKALGSDEYAALEDTIGGFFIQPQFEDRLLQKGFEQEWIRANGAMVIPTNASLVKVNAEVDSDRQTNLYGGVQTYWTGERQQLTSARGQFEQIELKPDFLTGLYYATDLLLRNVPALGAIIGRQFSDAFQRKETLGFLSGKGAGEPLGVLNSGALHSVTRTAADPDYEELAEMYAHCWNRRNAVWVTGNQGLEKLIVLAKLHTVGSAGSGELIWATSAVGQEPPTLFGRPIVFTEHAPAWSAAGGIMLVAWQHYLIAESSDFISDSSIHVRFDSLETAFRFARRLDGAPWWRSTLTVQNGYVMSPFVAIGAAP